LIDQDDGYYYRPKGMHQKTFNRIADKIDLTEEWANYYWERRVEKLLGSDWLTKWAAGEQP
jgi:hypothetical protein